ncbi:Glu/Leu/Phe/Val dehydrogenase dimerization domain-containing protein [Amycolatopsis sp. GM8]|uniref:Glu/Leu/Phe/Val family dehydrogenase n=1 Tax=Amycolatopsis sp. GM8 TaxID=2896530 RepID=UPI0027DFD5FF|nr:Glu/Leu/Phe/Val dehydrogenase dimerization domain-containing protein [Amycolatopsis sp. GM8]
MTAQTVLDADAGVFDRQAALGTTHEQVIFCQDERSGLRAIIGIHHTGLGPALGGTRFYPYRSEQAALADVLRLSEGMTYKAAAVGLPLGGGKCVIIGDPLVRKTPELLHAYGRFVDSLAGRYITAADLGTTAEDMDEVGTATRHVVGRTEQAGGSGDTGWSTAYGVFQAMRAAAAVQWGTTGLAGRTVGVEGAGKVGYHLIGLLTAAGAQVVVTDPADGALQRIRAAYDSVRVSSAVIEDPIDVYAPCALGSTLTPASANALRASVVCGAANNQLQDRTVAATLADRGVVWVPDYIANAGGLIQANGERLGKSPQDVRADIEAISTSVTDVIVQAGQTGVTTAAVADAMARQRLARAAR